MDLSYPIGKYDWPKNITPEMRKPWVDEIAAAPALFRNAVRGLDDSQLDTPYRPGGWTSRQVVHHLADSHMNSFLRFRLALTEQEPTIKPYDQNAWAALADCRTAPIESSLRLLEGLHARWAALLGTFGEDEYSRTFRHPEIGLMRLDSSLGLYAWHGRHHAAHITGLRDRMGWK